MEENIEAVIIVILIAKCLVDLYLKRLFIKNIGALVLTSASSCMVFRTASTTPVYNFTLLLGFIDIMIGDSKANEVYWINILFFMICNVIVSMFSSFFVKSFLILLIPVIFNLFTKRRFMGMVGCLIILGFGMSKSLTDLAGLVFHLGIISGVRALIYTTRRGEGGEIAFVPVVWSSFLLYVVMGNVF